MSSLNKVMIIGRLGKDPEVRYTANGTAIAKLTVATSEKWTDKNSGQKQEKTEWHRVSMFGKLAEIAGQYLKKGSLVYIEGRLQTSEYEDQQGIKRWSTEIVAQSMQMLPSGSNGNGQPPFEQPQAQQPAQPQHQGQMQGTPQQQPQQQGYAQQQPPAHQGIPQQPQGAGAPNPAVNAFDDSDIPF